MTVRPLFTFFREYLRSVWRKEGDAFEKAVWRGWNNWLRYSLRAEAHRRRREGEENPKMVPPAPRARPITGRGFAGRMRREVQH